MYLLLGDPRDVWCQAVQSGLRAAGRTSRIFPSPFVPPLRLSWYLDSSVSRTRFHQPGNPPILGADDIEGVLTCGAPVLDLSGWSRDDAEYLQTETMAGLLAWLWSLECPVINRYPPSIWYRPQPPLLAWQPLLRRAGLAIPDMLVTNNDAEARAFGQAQGAVYLPLMSEGRYLLSSEEDWRGVASLQRHAPVCLARPHGEPELACVVGDLVIWNQPPTNEAEALEGRLRRFATGAGLAWVAVAVAPTTGGMRVAMVEPRPRSAAFGDDARRGISAGLVDLLINAPVFSSR
jgi:hypothetical protein